MADRTNPERLSELAEKATPGPWHRHTYGHRSIRAGAGKVLAALLKGTTTDMSYVHSDDPDGEGPSIGLIGNGPKQIENSDYIAAASPDVILALLERAERAEARVAVLTEAGLDVPRLRQTIHAVICDRPPGYSTHFPGHGARCQLTVLSMDGELAAEYARLATTPPPHTEASESVP